MRPSSQEAYASSGPDHQRHTHQHQEPTQRNGYRAPNPPSAGWVADADVCVAGDLGPEEAYAS